MRRLAVLLCLLFASLLPTAATADGSSFCTFQLGFAALHNLIPAQVGDCTSNEVTDPTSGDTIQHTTGGLLVWRPADNWTAFTDGVNTWVNGPNGLQERPNTERFSWEANPENLPIVNGSRVVAEDAVWERNVSYPTAGLANPQDDVRITATFSTPAGETVNVDGFYYDTNLYKVRFTPTEVGAYSYTISIEGPTPAQPLTGAFTVVPSANPGFLQRDAGNPFRLTTQNGTLFNPVGLNDCWPDQLNLNGFIAVGQRVDIDTYFSTYGQAGFNLLRWNPGNCSFNLYSDISTSGNTYLPQYGQFGDALLKAALRHGFHIMFTIFYQPPYPNASGNDAETAAIDHYLRYIIARYGAYVDIWELSNETTPDNLPSSWIRLTSDYIRAHDPYGHLITNSYPRADDSLFLDIVSPHWYADEGESNADVATRSILDANKTAGLPVIIGEQGNAACNWEPDSAVRMRIRLWSAFFDAGGIVFWNSSGTKSYCPGGNSNIYLGPTERGYVQALQTFTSAADPSVMTATVTPSSSDVRAYGLQSANVYLAYLFHFADPTSAVTTGLTINAPFAGTGTWVDPATGSAIGTTPIAAGTQTLDTPSFTVDLALRVAAP